MGLYAHTTHIHVPDNASGRVIAGALLKSPQSLLISKPYGKWINVYLEPGLSYKDVKEFPTASHVELNVYNSEGFDVKLFTRDRLAFLYENGAGDIGEDEDQLLEIAAEIWAKENPDAAKAAEVAEKKREAEMAAAPAGTSKDPDRAVLGFYGLPEEKKAIWLTKAGVSPDDEEGLQKAANLWAKEHPEEADAARKAAERAAEEESKAEQSAEPGEATSIPGFWGLPSEEQDKYIAKARESGDFREYVTETHEQEVPACEDFEPFLPEDRSTEELHRLLVAMNGRLYGPPKEETEKALLEKWMDGKNHSAKAEDYVAAIARYLDVRGALWSLESIQNEKSDQVSGRIVPIDALDSPPAENGA